MSNERGFVWCAASDQRVSNSAGIEPGCVLDYNGMSSRYFFMTDVRIEVVGYTLLESVHVDIDQECIPARLRSLKPASRAFHAPAPTG